MLDIEKFKTGIKNGTGTSFKILLKNKRIINQNIENIIYNASINNLAYDAQSEGSRAEYMFNLISLYGNPDILIERIVSYFKRMKKNDWSAYQVFEMIEILIKKGYNIEKALLYKKIEWYLINNKRDDIPGISSLLRLEGVNGLLFITEKIGFLIKNNSSLWIDDSIIREASEITNKNCYLILKEKSKSNKLIHIYIKSVDKNRSQRKKYPKKDNLSSITIIKKIKNSETVPLYWGKKVDKSELRKFSNYFSNLKNENQIEVGIKIFTKVKYPFGYKPLLKYLESNNTRIIDSTLESLALFKNEIIHQIGLKWIEKNDFIIPSFSIFINNFSENDIYVFKKVISNINNEVLFHNMSIAFLKIFSKNKSKEAKNLLNMIYYRLNCGICRYNAIKAMINCSTLSRSVFSEMRYDSYEPTRKLYSVLKGK